MKIRKATKKDIFQMMEIIRSNSPRYPKNIAKKEIEEMFSQSLYKPTYLVIEDGKKVIAFGGFVRSWADGLIFNLFWVNVNPKNKGRGIGTKLIEELINKIKNLKEKPKAKLIILATKIPSFYKKFGFEIITNKYDKNFILMEKKLK